MKIPFLIKTGLIVILWLGMQNASFSQHKKLRISGSISLGSFHYYDNDARSTLKPFGASLAVNTRLSYGKFHMPIGISINNQGTTFQNPFNRYGLSPTYKWARIHLGWRQMQFSKFTMNGVQFFGAGIELTPRKFRLSAMHGKLDYRIPGIPIELIDNLPERRITALKMGYGTRRNHLDFVFMKASDQIQAIDILTKPKENAALGTDLKLSIFKNKLVFKLDGAVSVFTENRNLGDEWLKNVTVPKIANNVLTPNNSTHINYAIESSLAFNFGAFSIKNTYRRVMPEYLSMGLNYLRNDLESYLFSPNLKLWKNKLIIGGSLGIEKNNLDDLRNLNQSRVITSTHINIRPDPSHNLNVQYSNYSFDQTVKFDSLITNSVVIQQVNRNIGGTYSFSALGGSKSQIISLTANLQDAINPTNEDLSNTTLSAMINYSISKNESNSSLNFGFNYFDVAILDSNIKQVGLNIGYTFRAGVSFLSFQGGSMVSIDDKLFNSHLSIRYRMEIVKNLNLELSTRLRQNQRVTGSDRFMVRSDVRLVMRF